MKFIIFLQTQNDKNNSAYNVCHYTPESLTKNHHIDNELAPNHYMAPLY